MRIAKRNRTAAFMLVAVAGALVAPIVGCNKNKMKGLRPVEGVVLYEGVPLAWASVSLNPSDGATGAKMATAMTDENGRFEARTLGQRGAFPGEYAVAIEKYIAGTDDAAVEEWELKRADSNFKEPASDETTIKVVSAIPLEYSNAKESGLTATVPEKGVKDLKFELTK